MTKTGARPRTATRRVRVERIDAATTTVRRTRRDDRVVTEEPMEVRVVAADGAKRSVAVTMRTPGHDFELALGFLLAEGVVDGHDGVQAIRYCTDVDEEQHYNVVNVHLKRSTLPDLERLERHFTTSSACGVCGKAHLEALDVRCDGPLPDGPVWTPEEVCVLPSRLRTGQRLFDATGGLHAAGAFAPDGTALVVREDVGRHNAFDKVVGWAAMHGVDLTGHVVCVSGRASYEILQKAVAARVTMVVAVSAPSTLAVDVARRFGVTLVGFVRDARCVVYTGSERIVANDHGARRGTSTLRAPGRGSTATGSPSAGGAPGSTRTRTSASPHDATRDEP